MTLDGYERHLVGLLCWRCQVATKPHYRRQRNCPACRARWSYHDRRVEWALLKAFCLTAHHAARVVRCSYPTAHAKYTRFRLAIQAPTAAEKRKPLGEWESDESYFGGKRKGKRGRGAAGEVAVFGILGRAGKVFTVAVPNCTKDTLMGKIEAAAAKRSVFYTDEFTSYKDLAECGKHVPVNHQETFGIGPAHINGIEGFWSYAKRLYRHVHGVEPENFPPYLVEYEFRDNHRKDHLLPLLFVALVQPKIPK